MGDPLLERAAESSPFEKKVLLYVSSHLVSSFFYF